jgi:small subunit ribosomal protein S1
LNLSIKAKEYDEEKQAIRDHREQQDVESTATTLGDLIKAKMDKQ